MKLLIAYDGSKYAKAAVEDLQRAGLPRHAEAIVVSVAHHGWPQALKELEAIAEEGKDRVQLMFPSWTVSAESLWGDPAAILLKTIDVAKPDLVVVGSHGRSAPSRLFLGSVSTELVHHAPCSVRVVRHEPKADGPTRILIATDGSDEGEACVDAVSRRTWPEGTSVRILAVMETLVPAPAMIPALESQTLATEPAARVIEESDERQSVKFRRTVEGGANRLEQADLVADALVVDGDPRREIVAEAERWRADVVFVGARGLGALDRLLMGSVSTAVVRHASCAVEVVRRSREG